MEELYSEKAAKKGTTTEQADLIFASTPYKIMPEFHSLLYKQMATQDAAFYDALAKKGFLLDWGEDGSGIFMKYLRRGSGYYIDVGASSLIIDGQVKLEGGTSIERFTEHSVFLTNGKELQADVVILATGFGNMSGWVEKILSLEMAAKVGPIWGLGSGTALDPGPWEGELRNMWKPTRQESLWFQGGNLHQARHYSKFLALQLKARFELIPLQVFGMQNE